MEAATGNTLRVSLTWKLRERTNFHVEYARTFTRPEQVNNADQPGFISDPIEQPKLDNLVRSERADVYDVRLARRITVKSIVEILLRYPMT